MVSGLRTTRYRRRSAGFIFFHISTVTTGYEPM